MRYGASRIATVALRAQTLAELSSAELVAAVRRRSRPGFRESLITGCLAAHVAEWLADRWGADRSWPFGDTLEFAEALRLLLVDALDRGPVPAPSDALDRFRRTGAELLVRTADPYPGCGTICTGELAGLCLYRTAAGAALRRPDVQSTWQDARDLESDDVIGYPRTWSTSVETIAPEILGPAALPDARRAAALCFAQQAVAAESPSWPPWVRDQFVAELVAMADDDGADGEVGADGAGTSGPRQEVAP